MNIFVTSALAALIPLVVGFIWYNPKTFGNAWMKGAGLTEESAKGGNMALIFGLTYLFSFMIAFFSQGLCIHQTQLFSLMMVPETGVGIIPGSEDRVKELMEIYGHSFRTFRHGMVHGGVTATFLVLPTMAIGALFERRSWKYILINYGYWFISLMLMMGVVCQFAVLK
ncbi:MAG TPA: DUF1761 domain-containing protein [Chitinophagales bacterium]|nr:DUF1761 domain-containing protein [Chitinophagales bacterium]